MTNNHSLHELNLHYLLTLKSCAQDDIIQAQLKFKVPHLFLKTISNSSFQQLEQLAKQEDISYILIPNVHALYALLKQPEKSMQQLALMASH